MIQHKVGIISTAPYKPAATKTALFGFPICTGVVAAPAVDSNGHEVIYFILFFI